MRSSALDQHHGLVRFAWRIVSADGTAMGDGIDIAFISGDGARIARIIGFFGRLWHDGP